MAVEYYNLGSYRRPVTANSDNAQTWFNRGLIWTYAFNHEEAVECFERAISWDGKCAMAYWGLAYALGPNYNKPWDFFDDHELGSVIARTHHAAVLSKENSSDALPVEQALAQAIQFRYPQERAGRAAICSIWNADYAEAMGKVYQSFPDDLDIAALYADALMNLMPWQLWDLVTGVPAPGARTLEAKIVLESALAKPTGLQHPGLMHLYIHLMEMSPTPEKALNVADQLRGLIPDAGHLNHMPTHLDILCGDYRRAIASNQDAIRADEKFLARAGPLNFYTLYRAHDYHFCIYAAMFAGQSKVALETVARLEASIPEELLRVKSPPMADWLECFAAVRAHVLVRFGLWREILDLQPPADSNLYCVTSATIHYAKGIALAVTGDIEAADVERAHFRTAFKLVAPSRTLLNNKCIDILAVAGAMLDGELEYRRGNFDIAFNHLSQAIRLEESMPYDEPWGWMQPTRHAYAALRLEQGQIEDSAAIYAADLGFDGTLPRALQHPNNVWALHGYHECLVRLGRTAEARIIGKQLTLALATADVEITASCFCRRADAGGSRAAECC